MNGFVKHCLDDSNLHLVTFTKDPSLPCVLFVHGGPGFHAGVLEYLIEHESLYDTLPYNIILYDQRGCGRSKPTQQLVTHDDNIQDLARLCQTLSQRFSLAALIGHSYGAKLVSDTVLQHALALPRILIAVATNLLTPRINNLLLDLAYLKSTHPKEYQSIFDCFSDFNHETLWELSERLAPLFQQNKTRPSVYWANLPWQEKVNAIQATLQLPMNSAVFKSVRAQLYAEPERCEVNVTSTAESPCLWINGFHDWIMNGAAAFAHPSASTQLFYQSAHYPHLEEQERFCERVNDFLANYSR